MVIIVLFAFAKVDRILRYLRVFAMSMLLGLMLKSNYPDFYGLYIYTMHSKHIGYLVCIFLTGH